MRRTWSGAALPVVSASAISMDGSSATTRSIQSSASASGTTPSKGQWKVQDRLKRILVPFGASRTMAERSAKLSSRVRLRFALLWLSVTDMKRPSRSAPAFIASSKPRRFGTSTVHSSPSSCFAAFSTSPVSAICGTARGETKLPTSMRRRPGLVGRAHDRDLGLRRHEGADGLQAVARRHLGQFNPLRRHRAPSSSLSNSRNT